MGFNNAMGMALQQSLQRARQLQDQYSSPAARGVDAPAARWAAFGGGPVEPTPMPSPPLQETALNVPGLRNMRERVDLPMPGQAARSTERSPVMDYGQPEPQAPQPAPSMYRPMDERYGRTPTANMMLWGTGQSQAQSQPPPQPQMTPRQQVQQPGRQAQWAPPRQRQSAQPRYQASGRQGNGFMGGGQMKRGGF